MQESDGPEAADNTADKTLAEVSSELISMAVPCVLT